MRTAIGACDRLSVMNSAIASSFDSSICEAAITDLRPGVAAASEWPDELQLALSRAPFPRDRDRSYGGDFIARARRIGIETILTPVQAPNANAVAERVIGTFRRECLNHVIAANEQHLRRVLHEYVEHYNAMRPHRSLALDSPEGRRPVQRTPSQQVVSKPVLGGLHHEYRWAA